MSPLLITITKKERIAPGLFRSDKTTVKIPEHRGHNLPFHNYTFQVSGSGDVHIADRRFRTNLTGKAEFESNTGDTISFEYIKP